MTRSIVEENTRRDGSVSKIVGGPLQHERWCSGRHIEGLRCDNILEPGGPDSFGGQDAPHASAVLAPRREGGDAGHVPGCRREHSLDTACVVDAHEAGLARVVAAQDGLVACLRGGYALSVEHAATVLRVVDALASGVGLEARETLGREVRAISAAAFDSDRAAFDARGQIGMMHDFEGMTDTIGERLFALGRASVVPPDADLPRVIAAWPALTPAGRASVIAACEHSARRYWRDVAERVLSPDGCADLDRVRVTLHWSTEPGARVVGAEVWTAVEPVAPTVEQWTRLRAAGVPVVDGVGV